MKKLIPLLLILSLILAACGGSDEASDGQQTEEKKEIKVASHIPPMTDMLEIVKPLMEKDGYDMEIVLVSDNVQPNQLLKDKEVDANFFQHPPYMELFNEANDANLVVVQHVYDAPLGLYSTQYDSIDEIPEGATIAVPNDTSNIARSLKLMETGGLIKLKEGSGIDATQKDIIENPKNIEILEVDLLMLARSYEDVEAVTMLPAYAEPLGLNPAEHSLIEEGKSDFPISLIAREDNADSEAIQALAKHLSGPEIVKFLEENFPTTYKPAF